MSFLKDVWDFVSEESGHKIDLEYARDQRRIKTEKKRAKKIVLEEEKKFAAALKRRGLKPTRIHVTATSPKFKSQF